KIAGGGSLPMAHPIIALIGVPYDGAATLGWPGARYAPAEVRRQLTWMLNRGQGGQIYWVDEGRVVRVALGQLPAAADAGLFPRVDQRRCVQVGTRSFNFPSSKRFIDEIGLAELPARTVRRCGTEWTFARIAEVTSGADHIFLSVDIDVLDPAHAPGVGWHEPGGLTSGELLDLLVALAPRV